MIWILNFFLIIASLAYYIFLLNQTFLQCPNTDILLWDANIRMIQAIDFLQYFRNHYFLRSFQVLLDSPTWPPLRTIMSIIMIILYGKPDPILDTRFSIIFFFGTVFIIFYTGYWYYKKNISLKNSNINLLIIILSIYISISFLLLLKQIPEYLFNSMLEIQGMFFYTLFLFFIYEVYEREKHSFQFSKKFRYTFFLSGFLIYFTKYPYGVLISITLIVLEFLRNPKHFITEVIRLLQYYKNIRSIFIILPLISIILIIIAPHTQSALIKSKLIKNILYISFLISFIELNIFLYRKRINFFSNSFRFYYWYFIFPFSIVIFSHPDRFHSLIGAQTDTIDRGRSFLISIFTEYFYHTHWFALLIGFSFLIIIYHLFRKYRFRIYEFLQRDTTINLILFLWIHFFILEFLTTNHQARYIFQLIPGLLLFHSLYFLRIINFYLKLAVAVFLSIITILNLYILIFQYVPSKRYVCFSGTNFQLFDPAREIAKMIPSDIKGIIVNEFHQYKKLKVQIHNPYLLIPTDIDVHIRYQVFPNGFVINYSPYLPIPREMENIIYITSSCKQELSKTPYFPKLQRFTLKLILQKEIRPLLCLKIYKF